MESGENGEWWRQRNGVENSKCPFAFVQDNVTSTCRSLRSCKFSVSLEASTRVHTPHTNTAAKDSSGAQPRTGVIDSRRTNHFGVAPELDGVLGLLRLHRDGSIQRVPTGSCRGSAPDHRSGEVDVGIVGDLQPVHQEFSRGDCGWSWVHGKNEDARGR